MTMNSRSSSHRQFVRVDKLDFGSSSKNLQLSDVGFSIEPGDSSVLLG